MNSRLAKTLLLLIVLWSCISQAQVQPEDQLRARTSDDININTLMSYRFLSDFADTEEPRRYTNVLRANAFLNYKRYNLSVASAIRYTSVGSEVEASDNEQEYYFQDLEFSLSRVFWSDRKNSLTGYLIAVAPTNQKSQDLGVNGVYGAGLLAVSRFFKSKLILTNDLMGYGIANQYYFSTLPPFDVNQNGGFNYNGGLAYRITRSLVVGTTIGVRLSQYVDGSNEFRFRNLSRINYSVTPKFMLYAYYLNGSYSDQSDLELWYIDRYRQVAGAGINYVF